MNNPYYYIGPNPTVDLIVQRPDGAILLIRRNDDSPACPDMWALPGGFIDSHAKKGEVWKEGFETALHAALRELEEETSLVLGHDGVRFLGIYEGNGRDPRDNEISWSKSHAFMYKIDEATYESKKDTIIAATDAKYYTWMIPEDILNSELAFDHKQIIIDSGLLNAYIKKQLKM